MSIGLAMLLTTAAVAGPAKDPPGQANAPAAAGLARAVAQAAASEADVQSLKAMRGDHDQGDDHASPRAKEVVCSKNTPAAQRSAICDTASPN